MSSKGFQFLLLLLCNDIGPLELLTCWPAGNDLGPLEEDEKGPERRKKGGAKISSVTSKDLTQSLKIEHSKHTFILKSVFLT